MLILFVIGLTGIFVFLVHPALPETEVWAYIMAHVPPAFKGCIAIGLLAMTMSTADSSLHACSVIVSHDIMEIIQGTKDAPSFAHQIRLAKSSTIVYPACSILMNY
ncbi:hypothetical protein [Cardinium endosymbiont of Nabis limbatus]|uniref:hypothetical protein n=1 Tax=Cardinium endosymbiont of Nabis limbatus TaxID=3066217 RepID=UPI003AF37372